MRTIELPAKPDSVITPRAASRNLSSEAGVAMIDVAVLAGAADPAPDVKSASLFISAFASGVADATANEDDVGRAMAEEGTPVGTGHRDATFDRALSPAALFAKSWFR